MLPELDFRILDRELDRVKTKVFLGKNAAFLGSLVCSLEFIWDEKLPTAATDGTSIRWNPYYFHYLPPEGRQSILIHELWHVGLMHMLRRGDRDPTIWNYACDTVLDNMMDLDGYCVDSRLFPIELFPPNTKSFVNHALYGTMSAEEIYEEMMKDAQTSAPRLGSGDLIEPSGESGGSSGSAQHVILNNVVAAAHASKLRGEAGNLPGDIETVLSKFLSPKLPWGQILYNFFNELDSQDYSWSRPNRRYRDIYLPSLVNDHQGLDHIMAFEDVSGSISDGDALRFNSEFKYVKDTFQPEKLTLVQFDTMIQKVDVFEKEDPFEEILIKGRGGTSLVCVRDYIIEHEPTAVVIFSDLYCEPMIPLPQGLNIPIIWIALNNRGAQVNMGQIVHLNE